MLKFIYTQNAHYGYQYFRYYVYGIIEDIGLYYFAIIASTAWPRRKKQILYYCYNSFYLS